VGELLLAAKLQSKNEMSPILTKLCYYFN